MNMTERIYLSDDESVYLDSLILPFYDGLPKRKAMIVFPGGGYELIADQEGDITATRYFANDFNIFTLHYSIKPKAVSMVDENGVSTAVRDALRAVAHVRKNADKYGVDKDKICIMGYSAGGHLAATVATLWHDEKLLSAAGLEKDDAKPNAALLCYPVISPDGGEIFDYCMKNLFFGLCEDEIKEASAKYIPSENVSEKTCPTFIMHTATDKTVPVENAYIMSEALTKGGIAHELMVFPHAPHGCGLFDEDVRLENEPFYEYNRIWSSRSVDFLNYILGDN